MSESSESGRWWVWARGQVRVIGTAELMVYWLPMHRWACCFTRAGPETAEGGMRREDPGRAGGAKLEVLFRLSRAESQLTKGRPSTIAEY